MEQLKKENYSATFNETLKHPKDQKSFLLTSLQMSKKL